MVHFRRLIERSPVIPAALAALLTACGGGGSLDKSGSVTVDNPVLGGGGGTPTNLPTPSNLRTTGEMRTGRYAHTATVLVDGRVLVAGGTQFETTISDRAELYSPSAGTFQELTARLRYPRSNHTATRLVDGRVLLAGGWVETSPGVLQAQARAEVFDPGSGTFTEVGQMSHGRVDHAAVRLSDGRVLVTGGSVLNGAFLQDWADAEVFNPLSNTFSLLPSGMAHTHSTHCCLDLLDGRYFVAGGSDADLRCEAFEMLSESFAPMPVAPNDHPRFGPACAVFASGGAVVAGGDSAGSVLYLRPQSASVGNTGSALTVPRHYATATRILSDQVLVAGGVDFSNNGLLLGSIDLIVEGGLGGAQTYATTMRFPVGMAAHTATPIGNGRVLFCGGLVGDDQQSGRTDAFLYVP